ncbi:MAG: hypothetical protein JWP57_705, partial [Spirosoma sp.]|nr:hypothetical protein [Spirosoma sp.]
MDGKINRAVKRTLAFIGIALSWALCAYLVFRSTQLNGPTGTIRDLCQLVFNSSCDPALSSPMAWHLGYPLAGWGLAYFGALGLLLSLGNLVTDRMAMLLAALGVGISIIQSALIIRGGLSCPVCLAIHLINVLVLMALVRNQKGAFFWGQPNQTAPQGSLLRWSLLLVGTLIIGGISEVGVLRTSIGQNAPINLDDIAKQFRSERVFPIPKGNALPALGSPSAPVQVVVFSSFKCPACQGFAPTLEKLHQKFGNRIGVTFKNFPLSSGCNPRMSVDMQPGSCVAAYAALAAHRQNRFWPYHDRVFDSTLDSAGKMLIAIAKTSGLTMAQWESDRQSDAVKQQVAQDVQLAYELGVDGTPTVFINGRRVSNFQESVLT